MSTISSYSPRRASTTRQIQIRGDVSYRLRHWPAREGAAPGVPPLLLLHGWMDVGASFQRFVDDVSETREVYAIDWRGFGASRSPASADSYWFYDYFADLDAITDLVSPDAPLDLLGHSMGGNIAMIYAGSCPARIRRLVNVEGFGLARVSPSEAPARLAQWLAEIKKPVSFRTFASRQDVANHLLKLAPRMEAGFAAWLAGEWAQPGEDGRWHLQADAAHKRVNPILYRWEEILAAWENIDAPLLWVEGDEVDTNETSRQRYPRQEIEERVSRIKAVRRLRIDDCGHMVHMDQPVVLAHSVEGFLAE